MREREPDAKDAKVSQKTQKTQKKNQRNILPGSSVASFAKPLRNLCVFCVRMSAFGLDVLADPLHGVAAGLNLAWWAAELPTLRN